MRAWPASWRCPRWTHCGTAMGTAAMRPTARLGGSASLFLRAPLLSPAPGGVPSLFLGVPCHLPALGVSLLCPPPQGGSLLSPIPSCLNSIPNSPVHPPLLGAPPPSPAPEGPLSTSHSWGCSLHALFLGIPFHLPIPRVLPLLPTPSPIPRGTPSIPTPGSTHLHPLPTPGCAPSISHS